MEIYEICETKGFIHETWLIPSKEMTVVVNHGKLQLNQFYFFMAASEFLFF